MPTYSTRSVPTTSWSGRPVAGDSLLYDNGELYDNDFFYDGTMVTIPTYTTLNHPSTSYTSRVIPD